MKIKQLPEDFVVKEIIDLPAKSKETAGSQTYFWLTKKNWTTEKAIDQIARLCGASYRRFKFAGTKDKFAVTTQAVSAFKIPAEKLEKLKIKDISIEIIGQGDEPISLGTLEGNHFDIIVRDLSEKDLKLLATRHKLLAKKGFKNFFGEQRFGKGNTHIIGKEIIKGNLESAVRAIILFIGASEKDSTKDFKEFARENWGSWQAILEKTPRELHLEQKVLQWLVKNPTDFAGAMRVLPKHIRKLYVHAYQSWLWNSALANYRPKYESQNLLAVPGFKTELGRDAFSKTIAKMLKSDGLSLEYFRVARMPELAVEGEERPAVIVPKNFESCKPEPDELNLGKNKIKLSFDLPKGCYATTAIDALFKS